VIEVLSAYEPVDCCYDPNDSTDPRNMQLKAFLTSSSSVKSGLAPTSMKAFLSSESSVATRLREKNAFGPQLYTSQSSLLGTLLDCKTLVTTLPSRRGSRLFARLTVTHSPELFK
jgi:hypothetical protein